MRKPEKLKIVPDSSDREDCTLFMDTWSRYKEIYLIMNPTVIWNELRTACTPELNRLLFDQLGVEIPNSATEEQLLQHIRLVMVREVHKEVHWQSFHSMRQKERKSIMHFLARLWTLVKFWEFIITCSNKPDCGQWIDYSSNMVAGQMEAGLAKMEHQSKILAEDTILTTLQQKFDGLVSLEMTDQSIPHFRNTMHHTANVQRSDCKQQSYKVKTSQTPQYAKLCRGCGKYSHPNWSMDCKDCLTTKMAYFDCGIVHMEKECKKNNRGIHQKISGKYDKGGVVHSYHQKTHRKSQEEEWPIRKRKLEA